MSKETNRDKDFAAPQNHVVAVLAERSQVPSAKQALTSVGFRESELIELYGPEDAKEVESRPRWFADTDVEMRRLKRDLRNGWTVLAVPVPEREEVELATSLLKQQKPQRLIHFGTVIDRVLT